MKTYKFNDKEYYLVRTTYTNNNNLAVIMLEKGNMNLLSISANLCPVQEGFAFVDTRNMGEAITPFLLENKIATPTGIMKDSGYMRYQLWEFDISKLMTLSEMSNEMWNGLGSRFSSIVRSPGES